MKDSREKVKQAHINWFKAVYAEFLKDNKGFPNPLAYIEGVYGGDDNKDYWAKIARKAGYKCMKRNNVYYFQA